jgi:DGQHR domain-containing protein
LTGQTTLAQSINLKEQILSDEDEGVRRVGKLFIDFELEPIAHRRIVDGVGEIDLAFALRRDAFIFVFMLEVSSQAHHQNEKIGHFFSRWSDANNLNLFLGPLGFSGVKNMRIYIDFSRKSKGDTIPSISSIQHHLSRTDYPNSLLFADDFTYFEETTKLVGKWARSDLLNYLHVPRSLTSLRIEAIEFYLEDRPAFCFVADVRTLLDSCYISRRLGEEKGYQRALSETRIQAIRKEIRGRKIVAFPNSILVNCNEVLKSPPLPSHDCPRTVDIYLPTSYCSCLVVDGQHRLLGFSGTNDTELSQRHLPVIAFQQLPRDEEVKLFIDVNSKQKRIDSNLILDLKADFTWDPDKNYKEHAQRLIVLIARQLNENGPLRGRVYFGGARETKENKITLTTFVSVIGENQLVGGKRHFWQADPKSQDFQQPMTQIKTVFSSIFAAFVHKPNAKAFLLSNMGLRIVFRAIQILERNAISGTCSIDKTDFVNDLKQVLSDGMIYDLQKLYGVGGKVEGTRRVFKVLMGRYPKKYKTLKLGRRSSSVKRRKK